MEANDWAALGLIVTLLSLWTATIQRRISVLHDDITKMGHLVIPREEVNDRFNSVDNRHQREIARIEFRVDSHYRTMDEKLDRILDKLDKKADKE